MRIVLVICLWCQLLSAQTTLVEGAPNEVFDLSCSTCAMTVTDMAVVKGHQVLPYNLRKAPAPNLLHWRYFDKFLNKWTTYPRPLYGEECTQLIDSIGETDTVSLHINIEWKKDTLLPARRIYLLIGGLLKKDVLNPPIIGAFNDDVSSLQRFAAIAQIPIKENGPQETYEITDGIINIELFDPKDDKIKGDFWFNADRAGIIKKGAFEGGKFQK